MYAPEIGFTSSVSSYETDELRFGYPCVTVLFLDDQMLLGVGRGPAVQHPVNRILDQPA